MAIEYVNGIPLLSEDVAKFSKFTTDGGLTIDPSNMKKKPLAESLAGTVDSGGVSLNPERMIDVPLHQQIGSAFSPGTLTIPPMSNPNVVNQSEQPVANTLPVTEPIPTTKNNLLDNNPSMVSETQTTIQSGGAPSAKSLAELDAAYEKQKKAISDSSAIGAQKAAEEAGYIRQLAEEQSKFAEQQKQKQAQHEAELSKQMAEISKAQDEARGKSLDPDRLWKQKGTGARIVGAIAVGLGAAGSVLGRTENFALNIINDAVRNDIEAQKQELEDAKGRVSEARNTYAMLRQRGMDDKQAELSLKQLSIENIQNQIAAMSAGYKSKEITANAQELNAKLEMAKAQFGVELSQHTSNKVTTTIQNKALVENPEVIKDKRERFVPFGGPGEGFFALTKEDASLIKKQNAATESLFYSIDKMKDLISKNAFAKVNQVVRSELERLRGDIIMDINNSKNLGAFDEGTRQLLEKQVPSPNDFNSLANFSMQGLDHLRSNISSKRNAYLNSYRGKLQ